MYLLIFTSVILLNASQAKFYNDYVADYPSLYFDQHLSIIDCFFIMHRNIDKQILYINHLFLFRAVISLMAAEVISMLINIVKLDVQVNNNYVT